MLSQSVLFGSGRLEGVRWGAVRSSERRAIASRVGRLASDVRVERGGGCAYGEGRDAWGMVGARLLHLRSVGRNAAGEEDAIVKNAVPNIISPMGHRSSSVRKTRISCETM